MSERTLLEGWREESYCFFFLNYNYLWSLLWLSNLQGHHFIAYVNKKKCLQKKISTRKKQVRREK